MHLCDYVCASLSLNCVYVCVCVCTFEYYSKTDIWLRVIHIKRKVNHILVTVMKTVRNGKLIAE